MPVNMRPLESAFSKPFHAETVKRPISLRTRADRKRYAVPSDEEQCAILNALVAGKRYRGGIWPCATGVFVKAEIYSERMFLNWKSAKIEAFDAPAKMGGER